MAELGELQSRFEEGEEAKQLLVGDAAKLVTLADNHSEYSYDGELLETAELCVNDGQVEKRIDDAWLQVSESQNQLEQALHDLRQEIYSLEEEAESVNDGHIYLREKYRQIEDIYREINTELAELRQNEVLNPTKHRPGYEIPDLDEIPAYTNNEVSSYAESIKPAN
jgi:DNA repair ATPase RecN